MDPDAGPSHGEVVNSETTDIEPAAVESSSAASASHAAAPAIMGPDPGPEYIRPELISGGNAPKSNIYTPPASNTSRRDISSGSGCGLMRSAATAPMNSSAADT